MVLHCPLSQLWTPCFGFSKHLLWVFEASVFFCVNVVIQNEANQLSIAWFVTMRWNMQTLPIFTPPDLFFVEKNYPFFFHTLFLSDDTDKKKSQYQYIGIQCVYNQASGGWPTITEETTTLDTFPTCFQPGKGNFVCKGQFVCYGKWN